MLDQAMNKYFNGSVLYGDDFTPEKISQWYADEAEAYHDLSHSDGKNYKYAYDALNTLAGYRHIQSMKFDHALGMGSAYGDEFLPIRDQIDKITILESSAEFRRRGQGLVGATYVEPVPSGDLPFSPDSFDLILGLGVLHHIPNVSHVMAELSRCLKPGGYFLLREPVVSMGDWRKPRKGLTSRERGIPLQWLITKSKECGFRVEGNHLCVFPLFSLIFKRPYSLRMLTCLDLWICKRLQCKLVYHPVNIYQKLQPTSVYLALRKK